MGESEATDRLAGECPDAEADFPNLRKEGYRKTSEADPDYNCIAHAAGRSDQNWWPTLQGKDRPSRFACAIPPAS